jgi:hypothetical protein
MKLFIGRFTESNQDLHIDASKSHIILVAGKRGSGKSYTLGVIAEELCLKTRDIIPIIIDPMGIYWTMTLENNAEDPTGWGISSRGLPVRLIVPGDPKKTYGEDVLQEMEYMGVEPRALSIPPSDIEPDEWLDLYGLGLTDPMGILLYRTSSKLYEKWEETGKDYNIEDLTKQVIADEYAHDRTKMALVNRLEAAKRWGIFGKSPWRTLETFKKGVINVVDVSMFDPYRYGLRQFIAMIIAKKLFQERSKARRREEVGLPTDVARVWLLMDEAHQFIPSGRSTSSKYTLIRWVKEGRQPGLSIVLSTQQPSALDSEVLSQCDTVIAHKISMKLDLEALNALSQDYMRMEFKEYVRKVKQPGEAIFLDDEREELSLTKIRTRMTSHGGREKSIR